MRWEFGIKEDQAKGVIQILQAIYEGGISLFNDMLELHSWLSGVEHLSLAFIPSCYQSFMLSFVDLDVPHRRHDFILLEVFDVLDVVVGLIGSLELLPWLPGVNSFQDAELSMGG